MFEKLFAQISLQATALTAAAISSPVRGGGRIFKIL